MSTDSQLVQSWLVLVSLSSVRQGWGRKSNCKADSADPSEAATVTHAERLQECSPPSRQQHYGESKICQEIKESREENQVLLEKILFKYCQQITLEIHVDSSCHLEGRKEGKSQELGRQKK